MSGSPPPEVVSKDGVSIGVGGFGWFPEVDVVELKGPKLHFGKFHGEGCLTLSSSLREMKMTWMNLYPRSYQEDRLLPSWLHFGTFWVSWLPS